MNRLIHLLPFIVGAALLAGGLSMKGCTIPETVPVELPAGTKDRLGFAPEQPLTMADEALIRSRYEKSVREASRMVEAYARDTAAMVENDGEEVAIVLDVGALEVERRMGLVAKAGEILDTAVSSIPGAAGADAITNIGFGTLLGGLFGVVSNQRTQRKSEVRVREEKEASYKAGIRKAREEILAAAAVAQPGMAATPKG